MSRLIDVDKLVEELEALSMQITGSHHHNFIVSQCKNSIKKMVDEQQTVNVQNTNVGEWIPCSERFPEEQGTYFVTFKDGTGELNAWIWHLYEGTYSGEKVTYIDEKHYWANALNGKPINEFLSKRVIAWMPIPEPYNPEGENYE